MRQTRTRILSLLLALVMCLGLLPVTAMAAGGGSGEPALFLDPSQNAHYIDGNLGDVDFIIAPLSINPPVYYNGYTGEWYEGSIYEIQPDPSNPPASANASATNVQSTVPISTGQAAQDTQYTLTVIIKLPDGTSHTTNNQYPAGTTVTFYEPSTGRITYKIISGTGSAASNPSSFALVEDSTLLLEASYRNININITYDYNGAGETVTRQVRYRSVIDLPTPSLSGYRFLGWYRGNPEGQYLTNYSQFSGGTATKDITIYAMWAKESPSGFIVTFDPNGGTVLPTSKQTDSEGRVPGGYPTPTREGYTFLGWFTGDGYKPADDEQWSGNQALVAKWEAASSDICTVTFRYVNGPGIPPAPIKVAKGSPITLPKVSLKGYELLDWISGRWEGNTLHVTERWTDGKIVTEDVEICIWWKVIPSTEDTYNFGNDGTAFENYKITQTYFDFLTEAESPAWKASMKDDYYNYKDPKTGKPWGGSCFGMSAVYCMVKGGAMDLSVFQSGATTLRALKTPRQSQNIQDLINFYMMAQSTKAGVRGKNYYFDMEQTERYRKIVSDLKSISVLGFDSSAGGHAIVARSVEQGSDGYHIEIWDPNNPEGLGELVISPNFSSAYFTDETYGANAYNIDTVIKYIMPLSTKSQTYDAKNLQSVFGKTVSSSTQSSNSGLYLLSSSTGDFAITAADGRSAMVKGGKQVSGNLKLLDGSIDGGPSDSFRFYIEASDLDQVTITLDGKQSKVKFVSDAFMTTVAADTLSSVVVDGSSVTTTCVSSSQQEITVVSDSLGNTWNMATVSGKDTGFTLATEPGQLKVSSKNNVSVSVQGENVDTQKTSGKQTVAASSSGTAVAMNSLGTGTQQPAGNNPFTDVKSGAYYFDAVLWAVEKKVTSGTSATTFSPDDPCTRGQIVTFLWRAAGSPKPTSNTNPFTDVKEGSYYYDAVLWAVEKGITSGTSATTFSPDASCTRGQTVTFLYRAAGSPKVASSVNPFTDVKPGTYYYDAVLWAVEQKVTSGTSATTFAPDATVTRGQTVTFLHRSQGDK